MNHQEVLSPLSPRQKIKNKEQIFRHLQELEEQQHDLAANTHEEGNILTTDIKGRIQQKYTQNPQTA